MPPNAYVERLVNLLDPAQNVFLDGTAAKARDALAANDPNRLRECDGQFALVHKDGQTVRMARSIGRPMRYFLAKHADGPCLMVAERIDEIQNVLGGRRPLAAVRVSRRGRALRGGHGRPSGHGVSDEPGVPVPVPDVRPLEKYDRRDGRQFVDRAGRPRG